MNSPISPSALVIRFAHAAARFGRAGSVPCLLVAVWIAISGCTRDESTRVLLQSRQTADIGRMEILAQISGPQAGLRYKWYAVAGDCTPQVSDWPTTVFRLAAGSVRDRVTVEVWRENRIVATQAIDVQLDAERAEMQHAMLPNVQIEITKVPPYDPHGGPDTRADIAGVVRGEFDPSFKVIVYARADAWYIQPVGGTLHTVRPDNTWTTWTHTGSSYAALVVRPGYEPFARLDVLPPLGEYVVGRVIVDGKTE